MSVKDPSGTTINTAAILLDDDNNSFDYVHSISNCAEDGVYTVRAEYGGWEMFSYFIVNEEDDLILLDLGNDDYDPGDEVFVSGSIDDPINQEDEVFVTVLDPNNDRIIESQSVDRDGDEFEFELANNAAPGRYVIIVQYAEDQEGTAIFDVLA